jgi:hypothetical protein
MGFETPSWGRGVVCVIAFAAVVGGGAVQAATLAVPAGGDLQAAINAAQPGDVITLAAGATYLGNFVLPSKGASTTPIVIRSSTADSQLPRAGVRITPSYAALLAKVRSPNSMSALRTAAGAHHWTVMFLEFQANQKGSGDIIQLGAGDSSQVQLAGVPYALTIDRVYIHGDPALGQKRGIALNSADTTIKNSYISECKAVGQDAQAINGYNGPGPYLIENNYLEGAAETVLFGGSDPVIPNLVPSNITVRGNYMTKPLAWRNAIINPPGSVTAAAVPGGGSLAAGTYAYKVVARRAAGTTNIANSVPAAEASATLTTAGAVTISWTAVTGAENYVVYGRTAGGQNTYWITTSLFFTDTGVAGTAGAPPTWATKWSVKNLFELKNAQDVLIEGNVFENLWIADQTGYAIGFTPRNQDGQASWAVVQRITFRNNLVRHSAGGVNILGHDSPNLSRQTNHITIQSNVFDDLTAATWGSGSRFLLVGDGADAVVVDHNTVDTTNSTVVHLYGSSTPETNFHYTNNMSPHNSYGVLGDSVGVGLPAIAAYLPGGEFTRNVLAGGQASTYPTGNYFPTVASWQAQFVDFAGGNYRLLAGSAYKNAGTDGKDLGADVDAVAGWIANATSGDNSTPPGGGAVQIVTSSLPNGLYGQSYAQTLTCSGGSGTCAWALLSSSLPSGLSFNEATATISGTPTAVGSGSLTVSARDAVQPSNSAQRTLALTVDAPKLTITVPAGPAGQVGVPYQRKPSVSGALGTVTWIATSPVPAGLAVDPVSGTIGGVPLAWTASTTFTLQASDNFAVGRTASAPVTITIAPAPLTVLTTALPAAASNVPYSAALQAGGGTGNVNWTLTGGGLPPGVTLGAGGVISGTPSAAGTFSFTVKAADTGWSGSVASASLVLAVSASALAVVVPSHPSARVGQSYQLALSATGAVGTVSWAIASGALPSGLSLNASTGAIAGVPSASGSFTATVRATDSSRTATATVAISVAAALSPVQEIVLYAAKATTVIGNWSEAADSTAAGGYRMWNPNANAPKLTTPLAAPSSYFELTFQADAGRPYHLWVRGQAEGNTYDNDSFYVQFSGSVDASGAPINRIGTASATVVSIENGSNAGLAGWGWQDDSYGGLAGPMYFATTGPQTIRIQPREDGVSIDQIVLSAVKYAAVPPGGTKNDATILNETGGTGTSSAREVVLYAAAAPLVAGTWSKVSDGTAAGGYRLQNPDAGAAKLLTPLVAPANYFELTFNAIAGLPYHLWIRGQAAANFYGNDSVFVQFSGTVNASGAAIDRIGTTAAAAVSIEDGSGAGLSGWGWQDDAYGALAQPVYFATSGTQKIRVQQREDGVSIDQIVLSSGKYLTAAPGAAKNDTTILKP